MDAAVATAAALTVCEPTANGIGSDAFALIWVEKEKKLYGLNASGFSPRNISIDALKAQGHETMPTYGWAPTMVPALRLPGRCGQPLRRSAHDREHGSGYPLCPGRLSGFPQPGPDVEACL